MYDINIDYNNDNSLTDFGKATLQDRYLLPGETPQDAFARVANAYADDAPHAQRLYEYMSKLWFTPFTNTGVAGVNHNLLTPNAYTNT